MNVLQIGRKARFEVDALRTNDVKSGLWSDEEVLDAVNTAMDRASRILRLVDSDVLTSTVRSTGSDLTFPSEVYDPSSLTITSGTTDYTLPPDCVRPVSILPITTGFDSVRFRPAKTSQKLWMDQRSIPADTLVSSDGGEAVFWYTIIGQRTLRIAPTPKDSIDVELMYHIRPPRLYSYSTGTIDVTYESTSVKGHGVDWATYMRTPCELVVGSTDVRLDRTYPTVDSIDSTGTAITLKRAYTGSTRAGATYALAMIPRLPEEHHSWLAQMTAAVMLRKVSVELSDNSVKALEQQLEQEVKPEVTLNQLQESIPVEPFEIP